MPSPFASSANFTPPHYDSGYDTNGNGLFDFLRVNASLTVTTAGNFFVAGNLYDSNFTLMLYNFTTTNLTTGAHIVTIMFPGSLINQSGADGPYGVNLTLFDSDFALIDVDIYTTNPYSHLDFDPIAAFMTPPHPDFGEDTNGNGLFDFLNVDVQVYVNVPDRYSVNAFLHTANFTLTLFASNAEYLAIGPGSIRVAFPGGPINQSGIDGPYIVELQLSEAGSPLGTNTTTTQAYSHLAFDPIPAFMTPPHSDSGRDVNGNGLFDFLDVDVQVQVNLADNYTVNGFLHKANSSLTLFASGSAFLPTGPGSILVSFPGGAINQSGVDGPYTVELQLSEAGSPPSLGLNTTTTQAYNHLDFEGAAPVTAIQSSLAATTPTIDGAISPGEWNDSTLVDLTAISGNLLPAYLLVKNSPTMLYMAYDAVGDGTMSPDDGASLAFDTGNDAVASNGHEDQFVQGGFGGNPSGQSHWVYSSSLGFWSVEDAPYNQSLPNHAGLASAWGFGPSPDLGTDHRMYEFAIPLALLGSGPNQTLGFFGGSQQSPGVVDTPTFHYSLWPVFSSGPIPLGSYGDLILADTGGGGDTTPPSISINSPAAGELFAVNSITMTWTASDAGSGLDHFELRVDGGAPVTLGANVTGYTVSGLSDGDHTLEVTAFDGAGNSAAASVSVTVDATPPSLSITSPLSGASIANTTVVMTWTAFDATSGLDHLELSLDGGPVTVLPRNQTSYTLTGLSEGSHTATLVAVDIAGHSTTATRTFSVDTTAPTVTLNAPIPGWVTTRNVLVTWTASDVGGLDHIEVSLDGDPPVVLAGTATSTTLNGVSDGPHTITVQAFDTAGSSGTDSVSVSVDATAPTATLTSPTAGQVLGTSSVLFGFSASDVPSGIDHLEVSIDSGTPTILARGTTSYTFTGVSDGSHSLHLRAIDVAGNSVTASVTVTVDVTSPTVSITSPTASAFIQSHSVTVTWAGADPTSGIDHYLVSLDGGSAQSVAGTSTSYTFTGVSDGSHTIAVTAVDRAGNTHPVSVAVTVDVTSPTLSIASPSAGAVLTSPTATVTWTASDPTSGIDHVEIRVDGGPADTLTTGTNSYVISGLSDGTHSVNITVVDRAGNSMSSTVSFRTDTSFVSPSGPFGIFGLTSIILVVVAAIIAAILIVRRRRGRRSG